MKKYKISIIYSLSILSLFINIQIVSTSTGIASSGQTGTSSNNPIIKSSSTYKKNEKNEKKEKNLDLLQTCKLTYKCRTCSFDEVLTVKECEETGQTEIYQCPSVKEPVYNSCENGNFWSPIYIICAGFWVLLTAGMKAFQLYKEQLGLQLNFDR